MTIRAAIYARTSPDCPLSADDQIARLRVVAAERGWTVTMVFSDRPTSIKKAQDRRVGELAQVGAIRSGVIDKVLIYGIDRIGKSLIDLVGFLETCRAGGVSLWVDEQKLDTASSNRALTVRCGDYAGRTSAAGSSGWYTKRSGCGT